MKKDEFKVLSPTAILGYGYPLESLAAGMAEKPDLIAVDAGSVDPGPYYLGSGKPFTDRAGVKRDLRHILRESVPAKIPFVIGSAGGSGAKPHVDWCRDIIMELAEEENLSFRLGIIYADMEKDRVIEAVKAGETEPLDGLPELSAETVTQSKNIVAQMGTRPVINALREGCDVVLAGRAYDPSVFAALPIMNGFDPGPAVHMGKILECAAIAADPGSGSDSALGILSENSFVLKPLGKNRKFTATSTAAHTLYEKSNPCYLPGPGGMLDLNSVSFEELPGGMVKVSGSRFVKSERNMIKLEGARALGFRTVCFAGVRDPIMIAGIEQIIEAVKSQVEKLLASENISSEINFHLYGKNGVMNKSEPGGADFTPRELGILIETLAPTQEQADTVCSITRSSLLHFGYPGRIATAGNLAFPFSPSDLRAGAVYEFSIYHLMAADNEDELFKFEIIEVTGAQK